MMICCPNSVLNRRAIPLAITSAAPPAGNGTINRTGLVGKAKLDRLIMLTKRKTANFAQDFGLLIRATF
jgi:hypothetical protein